MSEALYYPYTSVQSLEGLKAMVLYFDKIHIINPTGASVGNDRPNASDISVLEENEVIQYISPSELLRDYDHIIAGAIEGDLSNSTFSSICKGSIDQISCCTL